jgi:hypothetical protein
MQAAGASKDPIVKDLENGAYEVELEYAVHGAHTVEVKLNGEPIRLGGNRTLCCGSSYDVSGLKILNMKGFAVCGARGQAAQRG